VSRQEQHGRSGAGASEYVLNCVPAARQEDDWTFQDALDAGVIQLVEAAIPASVDLREDWWPVEDQGRSGACVGFATAFGVLRWHFTRAKLIARTEKPSARFIWMANKETDDVTEYPTTFLEGEGSQTKLALRIARKYGCVLDADLPMDGGLSPLSRAAFYTQAARLRIASYHNLGTDPAAWRRWIGSGGGPILTRLDVDATWAQASATRGELAEYRRDTVRGGHAVCVVGYTPESFIVRNSWGSTWGDQGFAYARDAYCRQAFTEGYGAVL